MRLAYCIPVTEVVGSNPAIGEIFIFLNATYCSLLWGKQMNTH